MQQKAQEWNASLSQKWISQEDTSIYYVDGHVLVYHGHLANLGKKHVSRQKLCLPGMTGFWVNNSDGVPYFFVTGQVNEKLQQTIAQEIVPELNTLTRSGISQAGLDLDPGLPRYTLTFDREAYSPEFFKGLWQNHRVAVLTYRKNVKDLWDEAEFTEFKVESELGKTTMKLHELQEENAKTEKGQTSKNLIDQLKLREEMERFKTEQQALISKRKLQPYKITIGQMSETTRYNKLKTESKHLQNIIKMICYRAETSFANLLAIHYKRKTDEIRALVKSIAFAKADLTTKLSG